MTLPFFSRAKIFSKAEQQLIVQAIREAEKSTSGEIRVYVERRNRYVEPVERAAEVFHALDMEKTTGRNAVLVYLAHADREVAVFGDRGIHEKVGAAWWDETVQAMLTKFSGQSPATGTAALIRAIGEALKQYFPYDRETDQNELPDDIVFGR